MPISKETIIREIQRIAKANSGIPPGRLALESELGISQSAWCGVHWTKWNDAVREAGFEPNKLVTAYPKEHLLETLAQLSREIGHIPVEADIRMKARKAPGFPTGKTLARLGSKPERIAQLLTYCRTRAGFEDVVAICEKTLATSPQETPEIVADSEADGFVYLFKSGRRYKFGFTNDPDRRIRELTFQTSEPINKVHVIRTDDPSGIEAYWKNRFKSKCVHNEWFELNAKDVAAFKRRKKFM